MKSSKIIITSVNNLRSKYEKKFNQINVLLKDLVESDKKKDINTKVIFIDDKISTKKIGLQPVSATTPAECKNFVDKLFQKHRPDYLVIFGAQDVIPFQELNNPADDEDLHVDSDLPYACDEPYSKSVRKFIGPTRVVGRIPDVPGKPNVDYVTRLIKNIIQHKPVSAETYKSYFSISAKVWKRSTEISLHNMFGHNGKLILSPKAALPKGYSKTQMGPSVHFINCHGAPGEPFYYGEGGGGTPIALKSDHISSIIGKGTIVAAECCYGAQLFDPVIIDDRTLSIANNYLKHNAIAFLGSSTIAYGPADSQGLADLITQYFVVNMLKSASSGRALLEARQRFLQEMGPQLDPYELKTIAQFYLLGDPSIHAVTKSEEVDDFSQGNSVKNNRKKLLMKGANLHATMAPSLKVIGNGMKKSPKMQELLKAKKFLNFEIASKHVAKPNGSAMINGKSVKNGNVNFHTFVKTKKRKFSATSKAFKSQEVLVVKEEQSNIIGWRIYVRK
jgi:hypothetical protein